RTCARPDCTDRAEWAAVGPGLTRRTAEGGGRAGVTIVDRATTWIDVDVDLAQEGSLTPNTQRHGTTKIAPGAVIGPDTTLRDVIVDEDATVRRTEATEAFIGSGANVGPFTYLRPGTVLGGGGKIGALYETKNVKIGRGA